VATVIPLLYWPGTSAAAALVAVDPTGAEPPFALVDAVDLAELQPAIVSVMAIAASDAQNA